MLKVIVSKSWLAHILHQIRSIMSKHVTRILLVYWLDEQEIPSNELWDELDMILSTEPFQELKQVRIRCVYRDSDYQWHPIATFDHSTLPTLLPRIYEKGILT